MATRQVRGTPDDAARYTDATYDAGLSQINCFKYTNIIAEA